MKKPRRARFASLSLALPLALLFAVHLASAQEPNSLFSTQAVPASLGLESPAADSMIRLPDVDQEGQSWSDFMQASAIEGIDLMQSPVETASYATLSEGTSIKPISFQVGAIEVIPYGVLWSDMIYTTSRQSHRQFILFIQSEERQGEDAFEVESRYTRVGVNLKGPTVDILGGLTSGGKVEVDFLGGFLTENQPDTRLRHAYWEAKNDDVRFLVGQYWDLASPLIPNTVNFSVGWGAGNIGFRRAQFRVERYLHLSDGVVLSLQGAATSEVIQDFQTTSGITRESPNWPMIQARSALTFGHHCDQPITIGVSGHIGETGFDFAGGHIANPGLTAADDVRFRTWAINADVKVPFTDRMGFHGEFFTGANLSNMLGGIVQGVCPCLRVPIRATGGWGEIWYDLTPYVHTHVGFGIDDPNNADSLIGRTYNRMIYANMFLDVTDHLVTGLEVSSWRTNYHNITGLPNDLVGPSTPGDAIAIDWTVRFKF